MDNDMWGYSNTILGELDTVNRYLKQKQYELKDHLGNVRVVLSDMKISTTANDSLAPFKADVLAAYSHYPFGMLQPGMYSEAGTTYRFGFNGMLRDDEVKDLGGYTVPPNEGVGNSYDFGARMYNPRVTRFFSLDPMKAAFPWQSPYLYAGNDPVLFIDEGGLFQKKFDKDKYKTLSKIIDQAKIYAQQINQKIIPALVKYGQVKDQFNDNYQDAKRKVIKDLTPNRGVSVIVQNLKGPFYGMYIQGDEFIINQSFVEQLERGNANEAEFQALATHLLFTLYHEYSHSQDRKSKKPFSGEDGAEGFEKATTGVVMGNHLGNTLRMIKEGKLIPVNVENPYPKENKPNDREKQDDNEEIPKEN